MQTYQQAGIANLSKNCSEHFMPLAPRHRQRRHLSVRQNSTSISLMFSNIVLFYFGFDFAAMGLIALMGYKTNRDMCAVGA